MHGSQTRVKVVRFRVSTRKATKPGSFVGRRPRGQANRWGLVLETILANIPICTVVAMMINTHVVSIANVATKVTHSASKATSNAF
jgi:hypothetical protein